MFKYGVDSLVWTDNCTINDLYLIERVKSLGFDVFEIIVGNPETFPTKQVKAKIKEVGIEVVTATGLDLNTNLLSPDPKVRKAGVEMLKKVVDVNYEIGSKLMVGMIYAAWKYISGKPCTEDEWKWSVEGMREITQYAKAKGDLTLAVEVVNRFESHFFNIAADAVRYCKDVGTGNLKVHLDTFHMMQEESNITQAVLACGKEYLGYVHACENNRGIPGTGLVPWVEFYKALRKIGYSGPLTIEAFNPDQEFIRYCAVWRKFANSGEELAIQGLKNLKVLEKKSI